MTHPFQKIGLATAGLTVLMTISFSVPSFAQRQYSNPNQNRRNPQNQNRDRYDRDRDRGRYDRDQGLVDDFEQTCKSAVFNRLGDYNTRTRRYTVKMSNISVRLGETLRDEIDDGRISSNDLLRNGAIVNWEINRSAEYNGGLEGYCDLDGEGHIVRFVIEE